jgi:hypothetical protein
MAADIQVVIAQVAACDGYEPFPIADITAQLGIPSVQTVFAVFYRIGSEMQPLQNSRFREV